MLYPEITDEIIRSFYNVYKILGYGFLKVIVEIKAVEYLIPEHELQLINYLKATYFEVGLLLNFGPKPQFTRKVFSNSRKRSA